MEKLTKKQGEVLDAIKRLLAKNGYPPTVREVGREVNLNSSATIHTHITHLENKGYLKKGQNKNRTIELTVPNEYLEKTDGIISVPLLGKVTAGNPIEAIELPDEFFELPSNLIPNKKEVFALKVSGESMINAGIFDGDIVIIERKNTAINGEIVVAMTEENEVTLKTFYKEKDHIRLQPQNDTMDPIILNNVTILGKAIGLYRQL